MKTWHVCGAVALSLLTQGCSRRNKEEKGVAADPLSPAPAASASAAPTHYAWSLNVTKPNGDAQRVAVTGPEGDIPIPSKHWGCEYILEPWDGVKASHDEAGWLSCALGDSGAVAKTMVLCQETPAKPTDCGSGMLQVADKGANPHVLEMTCKSAASTCATRPVINYVSPKKPVQVRLREKSGALHFQWKFDIMGAGPTPRTAIPENANGEIPAGLAEWKCTYSITEYPTPGFTHTELALVSCTSTRTGDHAQVVMPCAENAEQPKACNMSSLVLTDEKGETRNIFMSCRGGAKGCWE